MALRSPDRTRDTSVTTGTGPFTLSTAGVDGYRTYGDAVTDGHLANGDTFPGFIWNEDVPGEFVWGVFTFSTTGPTVTVTTLKGGSNGASAVSFSAGTKHVVSSPIGDQATLAALVATIDDATTDAASYFDITHTTTGTPATNIGAGIRFRVETSANNIEIGALIEAVAVDASAGSEDFDVKFKSMTAGAAASEKMRMTSLGELWINADANGEVSPDGSSVRLATAATSQWSAGFSQYSASPGGPTLAFMKSRNATIGGHTVVSVGDFLGGIWAYGSDGTDYALGGTAGFYAGDTPGNNDMPAFFGVATSADGSQTPTFHFFVDQLGSVYCENGSMLSNYRNDGGIPETAIERADAHGNAVLGYFTFYGRTSTAARADFGFWESKVEDNTHGSTDHRLTFYNRVAGASWGAFCVRGSAFGYPDGLGTGGTVTQGTSRTTAVTINAPTGQITMFSAAGSTTPASFTVNNSQVLATDTIILSQVSGNNNYDLGVSRVAAGSFQITFRTFTGTATDAPVITYAIIRGSLN